MPDRPPLQLVVRTPHEIVLQIPVRSVRVLTDSGHVGLRPGTEATLLAVEAGLVTVESAATATDAVKFIGTAGGLLICDGQQLTLLTPVALTGHNEQELEDELSRVLQQPASEMEARATLAKLEGHIVSELRREQTQSDGSEPARIL